MYEMALNDSGNLNLSSYLSLNASAGNRNSEFFSAPRDTVEYALRKYAYPVIIILGFMGNSTAAVVFINVKLRKYSCSIFLATRSICDNGVLLNLFVAWLDFINIRVFHVNFICQGTVFLSYICSFLSVWCVVFVTFDNYIRMCHPSSVVVYCRPKYAVMIIISMVVFSLCLYNIPLWTTHISKYGPMTYCLPMQKYYNILYILTYVDTAITFVIPFSSILFCMCFLVFRAVRSYQKSSISRTLFNTQSWPCSSVHYLKVTKLLFAVSVIFLLLHTPSHVIKLKAVIELLSGSQQQPSRNIKRLAYVFEVLYGLNFAVNFIVYYTFGKNFRTIFKMIACTTKRKCKHKPLHSCPTADPISTDIDARESMV